MPMSLGLPYHVCLAATRLSRKLKPNGIKKLYIDQKEYFEEEYSSTERLLGRYAREIDVRNKIVLDVGSGLCGRAPWFIQKGAKQVICIDIDRQKLAKGSELMGLLFPQMARKILFFEPSEVAGQQIGDVAFLINSFEHLRDPLTVLEQVYGLLRPGGTVWIGSIGWYNYMASHLLALIPIPWCQVFFSEQAILRTIRTIVHEPDYEPSMWDLLDGLDRWDNVETLKDRPGEPLNMLSLRQIKKLLAVSPFKVEKFDRHGFGGAQVKIAQHVEFLARLPLFDELFHSYYSVQARRVN